MKQPAVLLVNDDPVTNMIHQTLVENAGFSSRLASNGREAIDSCLANPPDAVVMDVDMPVMNGLEAMSEITRLQRRGVIPCFGILATSAMMDSTRRAACIEAGAMETFSKPADPIRFAAAVQRAVGINATGPTRAQPSRFGDGEA